MRFNLKNVKKLQKKGEKLRKKKEKQEIENLILMLKDQIKLHALKSDITHTSQSYYSYDHETIKTVGKYFTELGFAAQIEEDKYRIVLIISWDSDERIDK